MQKFKRDITIKNTLQHNNVTQTSAINTCAVIHRRQNIYKQDNNVQEHNRQSKANECQRTRRDDAQTQLNADLMETVDLDACWKPTTVYSRALVHSLKTTTTTTTCVLQILFQIASTFEK